MDTTPLSLDDALTALATARGKLTDSKTQLGQKQHAVDTATQTLLAANSDLDTANHDVGSAKDGFRKAADDVKLALDAEESAL